jgi:hypothetical protein
MERMSLRPVMAVAPVDQRRLDDRRRGGKLNAICRKYYGIDLPPQFRP